MIRHPPPTLAAEHIEINLKLKLLIFYYDIIILVHMRKLQTSTHIRPNKSPYLTSRPVSCHKKLSAEASQRRDSKTKQTNKNKTQLHHIRAIREPKVSNQLVKTVYLMF